MNNIFLNSLKQAKKRPKKNDLSQSISDISKSISVLVERKQQEPKRPATDMKYAFMWQNLERLFTNLPDSDIDDLNYQFVTLTRSKIARVQQNQSEE